MTVELSELVKNGDLSESAARGLNNLYIRNADEFYCLLTSITDTTPAQTREKYAEIIGVPADKLGEFAEFIKPYVSEHIVNPGTTDAPGQLGCMFTEEQMTGMAKRLERMRTPEGYDEVMREAEISAMTTDPDFRNFNYKRMDENPDFRDWILDEKDMEEFASQFE